MVRHILLRALRRRCRQEQVSLFHCNRSTQQQQRTAHSSSTTVHVESSSSSTSVPFHLDKAETTLLVDNLLTHTRQLMGSAPVNNSLHQQRREQQQQQQHIIAFSGGVDSSLVAALVQQSSFPNETVQAVLGLSPAVPQEQLELAQQVAERIGVTLTMVRTTEGDDDMYIQNSGQACLACKTNLYLTLQAVVNHAMTTTTTNSSSSSSSSTSFEHPQDAAAADAPFSLYNGTNMDDLQDPTRLGLIAAQEFDVKSPLQHITKAQVRAAARHLKLPNWNYAASPCLRSRLALGVPATAQHLQRVERSERFVRIALAHVLDETSNVRVRLLARNRARIELDEPHVDEAHAKMDQWDQELVQELGFSSVEIKAFRSGSVATKDGRDVTKSQQSPSATTTTTTTTTPHDASSAHSSAQTSFG